MQFMPYNLALADCQPEDDIDQLFNQLPQLELPDELITRMLAYIEQFPPPLADSRPRQWARRNLPVGEVLENLIIHNEKCEPS